MTIEARNIRRPFQKTHERKKDRLAVMLLATTADNRALYRVRWEDNGRVRENTLTRNLSDFHRDYLVPLSSAGVKG